MAGLGEKGLRKRDGVNHIDHMVLTILSGVRQSKITKWTVLAGLGEKGLNEATPWT